MTLIPYIKDDVSETIYPIKINEYLGAGKPIVSTNFNSRICKEFGDVVYFASNEADFEQGIIAALNQNSAEDVKKRIDVAKRNNWQQRARLFSKILTKELVRLKKRGITSASPDRLTTIYISFIILNFVDRF